MMQKGTSEMEVPFCILRAHNLPQHDFSCTSADVIHFSNPAHGIGGFESITNPAELLHLSNQRFHMVLGSRFNLQQVRKKLLG